MRLRRRVQRPSLEALAEKHGAKKLRNRHGQTLIGVYEPIMNPLRDQPIQLLEIGIKRGASLNLWQEAFPQATIYALDIRKRGKFDNDRVHTYLGNQSDPEILQRITHDSGPLDLIIDDGSHLAPDQWASLTNLWPHLKPRGTYIIEDVHTSYRSERYGMSYGQPDNTIGRLCTLANDVYATDHDQPIVLEGLREIRFCFRCAVLNKL